MRGIHWVYGVSALAAMAAGGISEQGCTASMSAATGEPDAGVKSRDSGKKPPTSDASVADTGPYNPGFKFVPGDGGPCTGPIGSFPVSTCDPSDETAQGCGDGMGTTNGCSYDPRCGDTTTCEPFTQNPPPATGVDNFRMRYLNITAPAALVKLQGLVVTPAISLPDPPDGGANCGEPTTGNGLFNWLISVDRAKKQVTTGGSPPSTDPFGVGYCYLNGTVSSAGVHPVTIPATFTGSTFTTQTYGQTLHIPIFMAPTGVVILPIDGAQLNDVSVSSDGNCIGGINIGANNPATNCVPGAVTGVPSCSRWHAAGSLGGYLTLKEADAVVVSVLSQSLCVLLTSMGGTAVNGYTKCTPAGIASGGNYCSKTHSAGGCNDSSWLSATFAASAVPVSTKKNVDVYQGQDLCNGGSL